MMIVCGIVYLVNYMWGVLSPIFIFIFLFKFKRKICVNLHEIKRVGYPVDYLYL